MPFHDLGLIGYWNAATNDRGLKSSKGIQGQMYEVSVAGATVLDGISAWVVGDFALFNGDRWRRLSTLDGGSGIDFDTRAIAIASSIPVTVNVINTGGFATYGDGGEGMYKRRSGAPTLAASKAYFQSFDGAWWELMPTGGRDVFIAQFGGKADWTGTPGTSTDNLAATLDALSFIAFDHSTDEKFPYRINYKAGEYGFSSTIDLHMHSWLRGMNQEEAADGGTVFWFPSTVTCILISQNNTTGETGGATGLKSGGSSIIEDITIRHYYTVGSFNHAVYTPKHGIHCRGVPIIRNVNLYRIAGHGILIHGNSGAGGLLEGNPNQWHIRDSGVHSCGGHALCVYGQDANAGSAIGWTTHTEVGGCGIYDDSPFSNYYASVHIAGFGNRGVSRGGRRYVLLSGADADNPSTLPNTTEPGTNMDVWFDVGADDGSRPDIWPAWSSGGTYILYRLPIWDGGGASKYDAPYIEVSNAPAHILPASVVMGGTIGCTPQSSMVQPDENGVLSSRRGVGGDRRFEAGSIGAQGEQYTRNGVRTSVIVGKAHEGTNTIPGAFGFGINGGMQIFAHTRHSDSVGFWEYGYQGNDLHYKGPGGAEIWTVTTAATTQQFGTGLPQPYRLELFAPIFTDPGNSNNHGTIIFSDAPPAGAYARGTRIYRTAPSAGGKEGWVAVTGSVVVGGVVTVQPTWKEFGAIDA